LEAPEALFAMPNRTTATPTGDAPRWFQQMDANRDGSISLREFIGPPEVFQRLDENTDGFLDPAEATQGERGT
jgi:Ca2+-binding EF-hand superfamily protein